MRSMGNCTVCAPWKRVSEHSLPAIFGRRGPMFLDLPNVFFLRKSQIWVFRLVENDHLMRLK